MSFDLSPFPGFNYSQLIPRLREVADGDWDVVCSALDAGLPPPDVGRFFARTETPYHSMGRPGIEFNNRWLVYQDPAVTRDMRDVPYQVFLHRIAENDSGVMHDHWWDNLSIILFGGYREINDVETVDLRQGDTYFRYVTTPHMLTISHLPVPEAWTLFVVGPKLKEIKFYYPDGLKTLQQHHDLRKGIT